MPASALVAALCGCILLIFSMTAARAERRIALVVGNANYTNPSLVLPNPRNDAEDVAAALGSLGFEVIQAIDTSKGDLESKMANFARLATDSDAALFYYAGHAVQYQGRNYLMPIDAQVEDEVSLRFQMVPIDDVRVALDRATGVKVMILDACRNNPLVETLRRRTSGNSRGFGGARGLARIDKTQGMVIAYSTAADEVAADGNGRNSPFTGALLKRLKEPGLEIEQLFRRVAGDVNSATGGRQRPETYISLLSDYYLNQTDRIAYDAIRESTDTKALQTFISRYPTSSYAADARNRIQRLDLAAQERLLEQVRQQQTARQLEDQRKAEIEALARQLEAERRRNEQARADESARLRAEREAQEAQRHTKIVRAEPSAPSLATDTPSRTGGGSPAELGVGRPEPGKPESAKPAPQGGAAAPIDAGSAAPRRPPAAPQACDQDMARLAQLRGLGSLDDVTRFERELGCERLRPQIARLRESLADPAAPEPAKPIARSTPEPSSPIPPPAAREAPAVQANRASEPAEIGSPPKPVAAAPDQEHICKQDAARITRLRGNPNRAEVLAFERDLKCEKLRPQLARIRESLAVDDAGQNPSASPAKR